jgi:hypothetical protein
LLLRLYALNRPDATRVTLGLFSEHRGNLLDLAEAYRVHARAHAVQVTSVGYQPMTATESALESGRFLQTHDPAHYPDTFWQNEHVLFRKAGAYPTAVLRRKPVRLGDPDPLDPGTVGLGLEFVGPTAEVRFSAEEGLHKFPTPENDPRNPHVLVAVRPGVLLDYCPPFEMVRKGAIPTDPPRRVYDRGEGRVVDHELSEVFSGLWGELDRLLDPVLTATVRHRLRRIVLE